MKNVKKIYETIGETILDGANSAVKAYNWTTGGTKKDLANNLLNLSVIADSTGSFLNGTAYSLIMFPLSAFLAHHYQKRNNKQQALEESAKNNSLLNAQVEFYYKPLNKIGAVVWIVGATYWGMNMLYSTPDSVDRRLGYCVASGLRASSSLIMNADNLPPRKNCFSRGIEKLSEMIQTAQAEPAFPFSSYYLNALEEKIK